MAKFRKKPVEIEAIQFTGENAGDIRYFVGMHMDPSGRPPWEISSFRLVVDDLFAEEHGVIAQVWDKLHSTWVGVKQNQWIIRGIQGEYYPCDPDVFSETYEPV